MLEERRLARIINLLDSYKGDIPLQHFLRNYFRQHREMGSNDRKIATQSIYNWFRLGKALTDMEKETRLAIASFFSASSEDLFSAFLTDKFTSLKSENAALPFEKKIKLVHNEYPDFDISNVFPFSESVSKNLELDHFIFGIMEQPYVWLRAKKKELLTGILKCNKIAYIEQGDAIGIRKPTSLLNIPGLKEEWFEVQDLSSQRTGEYYLPNSKESWYDCCAASGGKSLLLHGLMPDISITVSDNRESILQNLKERFLRNGIKNYNMVTADLENELPHGLVENSFDGIIADVPCSGSGTWSRSPEQISYFDAGTIKQIEEKQKRIIQQVTPLLKKGKPLIYITCSVFKAENEDMTEWIATTGNFKIEKSALIQGSAFHADTIYVARLIRQ